MTYSCGDSSGIFIHVPETIIYPPLRCGAKRCGYSQITGFPFHPIVGETKI